jgi:hypothetical protein
MVAVVLAALLFWGCVFMIYFTARGVSPSEFFAGSYEPYDPKLAQWQQTSKDPRSGLLCEQRWLLPDARERASYLERQTRYRDPTTLAILRIDASQRVPRRRLGRGK